MYKLTLVNKYSSNRVIFICLYSIIVCSNYLIMISSIYSNTKWFTTYTVDSTSESYRVFYLFYPDNSYSILDLSSLS